ncbi:MAG: low molecular weight phosphotyrosine protein phosphatase [Planctomycetes bacterium]|nr:low molecular weight phosphotyrosine protein phosphatase [Planctomycetota bacterium]
MSRPLYRVLFVCLGNICRSPAAEGLLRQRLREAGLASRVEVRSAGILGDRAGEGADPRMQRAAAARGIELRHRARKVDAEDLRRADLVLAMDASNLRALERLAPSNEERAKLRLFASYCRAHAVEEIPDPYLGTSADFELVLDLLEDGCAGLVAELAAGTP